MSEAQCTELSEEQLSQISGSGGLKVAVADLPDGDRGVDLSDLNNVRNNFGAGL